MSTPVSSPVVKSASESSRWASPAASWATTLSLVVGILLLGLGRLLRQTQSDVNLHLSITNRGSEKTGMQQIQQTLEKYCSKLRLIRYDENSELMELAFVVEFRHLSDLEQARDALLALSPQMEVSFLDNKGIW